MANEGTETSSLLSGLTHQVPRRGLAGNTSFLAILGQRVQEFHVFHRASEGCVCSVAGKKVPLKG